MISPKYLQFPQPAFPVLQHSLEFRGNAQRNVGYIPEVTKKQIFKRFWMQEALFKDISNITLLFDMTSSLIKFWFLIGDNVEWQ